MMFRLPCVSFHLRRFLNGGTINRDQVLERLQVCSVEDQVFDLVSKNKAKFTVDHVSCAVGMLWQFQKEKPQLLRTVNLTKSHPEFLTLRVLAENKISSMDDLMLVDMLYGFLRLNVEPHSSLVQQMVSEACLRLDGLSMICLSKFSVCLNEQQLQLSPLMGRITSIVDQKLSSIDDARVLTALMISVSGLVSPRLRDALLSKADHLLDTMKPTNYNVPRRMVQFLRNIKYAHRPLLEKCNKILLRNISRLEVEHISIVLGLYQSLQFTNCDFRVAAKQKLSELMESSTDTHSFTRLFVALAPMARIELRERLESTALLFVDEFNVQQALVVAEALQESQSRNHSLLNKVASVIQSNIHHFKSLDLARATQALFLLQYQNPELLNRLRNILVNYLQHSFIPFEVAMLTRALSMLPTPRVEECVVSRVVAVVAQCNLNELSSISAAVAKWARTDSTHYRQSGSKYVRLQQTLNHCAHERLQTADRLDLVLDELKYITGDWFEEILLEETIAMLQRLEDQINWTNVAELALFMTRINHFSPPIMDRIASVALEHIDKIHYSALYAIVLPFSVLNYDTAQVDELYDACIERLTPHISSLDPHLAIFVAYNLAVADRFPEELIREIFSIDFLGKLDSQLEVVPDSFNMRIRLRLMELNRAVCLECPEFQVPWFHEHYCQQIHRKGNRAVSSVQQQIHKMLGQVLGGINYVQMAVVTPYFYTINFECKLDTHMQPLPYSEPNTLQLSAKENAEWKTSPLEKTWDELPPGAQRVAVDFLDSKSFCKNSHHVKGETLMRKRHLEILGYRVVQIPHFEWNSMELSTHDAWKEYLKNKILT